LTALSGELFLHPDAVQIIRCAKGARFKHIGVCTKVIALWRHEISDLLISGIDAISISFPGFQPNVFEKIYQAKSCEDFRKSVKMLLKTHKQVNSKVQIVFEPRTYLTKSQLEQDDFFRDVISGFIGQFVHMRGPLRVFDTWGGEITQDDLTGGMRIDINPVMSII
jgi:MoaA/NifB/PqqE/SkfB family radical SAM enzyme